MSEGDNWNLVAPCGLYCGECTGFLDGICGGCRSNQGISLDYSENCKIYQCLNSKNLKICSECKEFPCKFFGFFKSEKSEIHPWFLEVSNNMRQIKKMGLPSFLKEKGDWVNKRKECAQRKGMKYCDVCKQWPCELMKRATLVPVDLKEFREFMKNAKK